jgi:hypothetical protein
MPTVWGKILVAGGFNHAYYNFCRVHQTLRVTPAMETGIADHAWTLQELVSMLEYKELTKSAA